MVKKIVCIVTVLSLIMCIAFECSINASAVVIADDALVIASVFLACAGAGLTVYTWSEYFQGDTWHHFCTEVAGDISTGFQSIVRSGKHYVEIARDKWGNICNWVKSKFQGKNGDVEIDIPAPSVPATLTLGDGTEVPYASWMQYPFFIYRVPSSQNVWGVYCTGEDAGVNFQNSGRLMRVLCKRRGETHLIQFTGGVWTNASERNMTYGITYMGVTGSFADINLPTATGNSVGNAMQYRTMPKVSDAGVSQETEPPNTVTPSTGVTKLQGKVDASRVPDAVDSPVTDLAEGEKMIIEIPQEFLDTIETQGGQIQQITTDVNKLTTAVNSLVPADVRPQVLTVPAQEVASVDQIINDTVEGEMEGVEGSPAESDIEIANKFRLPKSFLEGFPFSIPYSVYLGISSLLADPEAPSFVVPFSIPRLGIEENVVLDLEQFSPLARLCRALLSLVWVAGLAMACNKFIKR